ncbi:hypothetical protein HAX54_013747, partial [Datura stramonium]|nr:hypothetical protein [Datura stramonium]
VVKFSVLVWPENKREDEEKEIGEGGLPANSGRSYGGGVGGVCRTGEERRGERRAVSVCMVVHRRSREEVRSAWGGEEKELRGPAMSLARTVRGKKRGGGGTWEKEERDPADLGRWGKGESEKCVVGFGGVE